tara:strand:- start:534 stop:977 length:444 start_codon:yes stop_codon:yes gene_type:complete
MANNASNYLELALLNHIFGNNANAGNSATSFTAPADNAIYVSLHTADPTDAGTGAEISGAGYTRSNASNSLTWTVAQASGTTTAKNDQAIAFPQATADYSAQVTHIGIWDAASSGNLLFHGGLTVAKTVTQGDTFQINANALVITLE